MPIPFAAIVVSLMILRITARLTRETVAVLMDEVPAETRSRIVAEVERVPGVLAVEQARVRRSGADYFADLTLALPRRYTFEHTGELVRAATDAVHRALPQADVVIHTVPRKARAESIFDRVRAVAARNNVSVHDLSMQSHHGKPARGAACGIGRNAATAEGARFCHCASKAEILRETPEIDSVLTHIESEPATIEAARRKPGRGPAHREGAARGRRALRRDCGCARDYRGALRRAHLSLLPLHAA